LFIVIILRKNIFFYEIYREKSEVTNANDRWLYYAVNFESLTSWKDLQILLIRILLILHFLTNYSTCLNFHLSIILDISIFNLPLSQLFRTKQNNIWCQWFKDDRKIQSAVMSIRHFWFFPIYFIKKHIFSQNYNYEQFVMPIFKYFLLFIVFLWIIDIRCYFALSWIIDLKEDWRLRYLELLTDENWDK
jgi:hypothetical protein